MPPPETAGAALWLAPRRALVAAVRWYQRTVSPLTPPSCRFTPTCSQYAAEALARYGVARGGLLAVWRLARCHPLGGHGWDPPRWFGEPAPPSPAWMRPDTPSGTSADASADAAAGAAAGAAAEPQNGTDAPGAG